MSIKIVCCYAHEDQALLDELIKYLVPLQRQETAIVWADTHIKAGSDWEKEITKNLKTAQIILCLVSPDFLASDYCYSKEIMKALERHEQEEVRVIPIILRPCLWQETPLGKFQALPMDGKPVTNRDWHTPDDAFLNIALGIRETISQIRDATSKLNIEGIVYRLSGQLANALTSFEKATRINPDDPEAYYNKYMVLMMLEEEQEALKALKQARLHGLSPLHNVIGRVHRSEIKLFKEETQN